MDYRAQEDETQEELLSAFDQIEEILDRLRVRLQDGDDEVGM